MTGYPKKGYDELIYGWASYVKKNNKAFLKYGSALLIFAIEVYDLNLIDDIYYKCLNLFKDENNKAFLNIINTSMPLLNKYYSEYITRYSLGTNLIIDSPNYKMEHLSSLHLYPFFNIKIVDLTPSIHWTKYTCQVNDLYYYYSYRINRRLMRLYFAIETLIFFFNITYFFSYISYFKLFS